MLLPGSQTPHAMGPPSGQLPSLGVPCMVLPSSTLGPFPVLYSPTMAGPVSPAPGTVPNTGPGNFRLPGLRSTPHLLIGPAALVNPNSSTLPSADPQLQGPHSLNQSPVMSRPHNAIQPASPVFEGHPGSLVKLQQVSPEVSFQFAQEGSSLWDGCACISSALVFSHLTEGPPSSPDRPGYLLIKYKGLRQEIRALKTKMFLIFFKSEEIILGLVQVNF